MGRTFYEELGKRLRDIRISQNKTQQDVADRLGIARQNVSYYEKGIRTLDIDTFFKICDIFNVDPNEVLNGLRKLVYRK